MMMVVLGWQWYWVGECNVQDDDDKEGDDTLGRRMQGGSSQGLGTQDGQCLGPPRIEPYERTNYGHWMAIILMIMLILAHQELQHMKKTVMISSMIKFLRRREGESRTRLSNKHIIMINIPSSDFCCIFTIYFHNHLTQQLSAPGLDSLAIPCHTVRQGSPNN